MNKEQLIQEILEIVHRVADAQFSFDSHRRDALIEIRNKILEFSKDDLALEKVVIYLNGFIQGLYHKP